MKINNVNLMNKDIKEKINKFDKLRSIKGNNSKNHFKNSPCIENSKKNEEKKMKEQKEKKKEKE